MQLVPPHHQARFRHIPRRLTSLSCGMWAWLTTREPALSLQDAARAGNVVALKAVDFDKCSDVNALDEVNALDARQ